MRIRIIGIGAGDPNYLTLQAIEAIGATDVFFLPDKGEAKSGLRRFREELIARHARAGHRVVAFDMPEREISPTGYEAGIASWRSLVEETYRRLIAEELGKDASGAFLVWGDPALYDGTIGILTRLREAGLDIELEMIPGISAMQALAARHRLPLSGAGEPVLVTTGRRLREGGAAHEGHEGNILVMLDSGTAWDALPPGTEIFWGAALGLPEESLVAGRLPEAGATIAGKRAEIRARLGWIMDTYLLRRPGKG